MTLSREEREQLLDFIKSKYVDYHDVRLLIAKDLEKDITEQMKKDDSISFEEALEQAYKKYGVIGFSDTSEDYMKKIDKYFYKKIILKSVINEVSTLKFWLVFILSFIVIDIILMAFASSPFIMGGGFLVLFIVSMILFFRKFHREMKALKEEGNLYYIHHLLASGNSYLFQVSNMPLLIAPHVSRLGENEFWSMIIIAAFASVSVVGFYLMYFKIYKERYEILHDYKNNFLTEKLDINLNLI